MATGSTPTSTPTPGTVVHYDVADDYDDQGPTVNEHAGLVVASDTSANRVRVIDLGAIKTKTAEFPADIVRIP